MRFFIGDDNGFIKALKISRDDAPQVDSTISPPEPSVVLRPAEGQGKENSVDRLTIWGGTPDKMYSIP
jgi:hypothetical protein